VKHYAAYRENYALLLEQFVEWYGCYLVGGKTSVHAQRPTEEIVFL
jgi:hypothetical protein